MTVIHPQIVKVLASRRTRSTAVALIVAGALVIHAAPAERFPTAAVGGSLGFSLVFVWLFFHCGLSRLPARHRGPALLLVLVVLSLLLFLQVHALVVLTGEVLRSQAAHSRVTQRDEGRG